MIKTCLFIQEYGSFSKKLFQWFESSIKRSAKGVKAFQLSQIASRPFYREKGNSVTHAVSWWAEGVLHLKVWHFIWKRKQTKIALLSDYTDRFCMARWALWNQYHFRRTACGAAAKIHSWPAGDLLLLISDSEEQDFPPIQPEHQVYKYLFFFFFNILYVFCMKKDDCLSEECISTNANQCHPAERRCSRCSGVCHHFVL